MFDTVMKYTIVLACLASLAGCGFVPEKLPFGDPQVQQLLRATYAASAYRFGFTPVPTNADIRLEKSSGSYDRMLHVYGRTSRTIAFRRSTSGFTWIGEQETYQGPKQFTTPDGTFFEEIYLTYELQPVAHYKMNRLNIGYNGNDSRLAGRDDLTLQSVLPILREWGYDVELIGAANRSQPVGSETNQPSAAAGSGR